MAEVQKSMIKGAEIFRFENSGHGLFYNEDDKLFEELLKFREKDINQRVPVQVVA